MPSSTQHKVILASPSTQYQAINAKAQKKPSPGPGTAPLVDTPLAESLGMTPQLPISHLQDHDPGSNRCTSRMIQVDYCHVDQLSGFRAAQRIAHRVCHVNCTLDQDLETPTCQASPSSPSSPSLTPARIIVRLIDRTPGRTDVTHQPSQPSFAMFGFGLRVTGCGKWDGANRPGLSSCPRGERT